MSSVTDLPQAPMSARSLWVHAVLLLFPASAFVTFAVRSGRIPFTSDQAVVGLMARHILAGMGHPVFYYGVTYDGSFEPHFVAGVFAFLGSSVASYRVAMALLLAAFLVSVFLVAARAFGKEGSFVAFLYLAISPFFLLYKGMTSDGAYDTIALVAIAVVAISLEFERRRESARDGGGLWLLFGFAAGLGVWISPVTVPVSAACFLALLIRRPGPFRSLFLTLCGAAVGAFPWWFWNVRHAWRSVRAPELGATSPGGFWANAADVLWTSIPALEGGVRATPDPHSATEAFLLARPLTLLCLGLLLAPSLFRTLRGHDRRRVLLWSALAAILLAVAASHRTVASEPRFLIAYYALVPLLLADEYQARSSGSMASRLFAAGFIGLLALHVAGIANARVNRGFREFDVAGSLDPLMRSLEARDIHDAYSDYWTAYRLTFESDEKIIVVPFPGHEVVRYEPDANRLKRAPNPAVLLLSSRDRCFGDVLRENRLDFTRFSAGAYGVYSDIAPAGLEPLRSGKGLPLPMEAYRVRWDGLPSVAPMPASSSRDVEVSATNIGPCPWPTRVHVGTHWWAREPGAPSVYDGARGLFVTPVISGATIRVGMPLVAPKRPGRYRLEFDMVQENVDWFSTRGGATASVEVEVVPRVEGKSR